MGGLSMAGQLIPPPELALPVADALTPTQRIALWMGVMNICEQFLLAGLRREIGSDGDRRDAYRQWYATRMDEHDQTMRRMLEELSRRGCPDAG
jgi:hypothetical protein